MFKKVLIANRGEIACRIIRTLRDMNIGSVAVYSDADRFSKHVKDADEAVRIGRPPAAESYLDIESILAACRQTGADAVHPGYGLLSESAEFSKRLEANGIAFIGPTSEQLEAFGLKHRARELAKEAGVPLLPGSQVLRDLTTAQHEAQRIGYPLMLKSVAGGGGIGLQLCHNAEELESKFISVGQIAKANFGEGALYVERFVPEARHIEVQIFGDGHGTVAVLGDRDCSLQRRNQKVIEEAPAPLLSQQTRQALHQAAQKLGQHIQYRSAGTVEFLYEPARDEFYFLEVNTRLQVEHPVTEMVTGVDLVEWMVLLAAGHTPPFDTPRLSKGAAIEARLYAENPLRNFSPSAGRITTVSFPDNVRIDTWIESGTEVSPHYDPMIAKVIVHGETRDAAVSKLQNALAKTWIDGIVTNLEYLQSLSTSALLCEARQTTKALDHYVFKPNAIDVIAPGAQTTIQDWPGRLGHWDVGVPPSGPMDPLSFRLLNRLLNNDEGAPGLEIIIEGPTLRFLTDCCIAFGGANIEAVLDEDIVVSPWSRISVSAGQTLSLGKLSGCGQRAYLAVAGGLDVPKYLDSAATFTLGGFGGLSGQPLRSGDLLPIAETERVSKGPEIIEPALRPTLSDHWELQVLYGPHGAPEFFTETDIDTLFASEYKVHFNSSRTGVRLVGPKPDWARPDGGEAGLHPSNIHDNAYAIGAIDFTGDMPILLGPDGPSLGGFVCPAVVTASDIWKLGQLKPGDTLRFTPVGREEADLAKAQQDTLIANLEPNQPTQTPSITIETATASPVLYETGDGENKMRIRRAGSENVLVEFGPPLLDLAQRFRAHALMTALDNEGLDTIVDLTPGVRSLQVHYESNHLSENDLLDQLIDISKNLPPTDEIEVDSRVVHLPLAWDHSETQKAIRRYQELVRNDAPWCPSNIEFIRRINGLDTEEDVKKIVFDASYMVLGLGDVYLGAPVATPIDPRHRLVTTKYNPARTWTPENAVGIGGAYMCIYGMEGPGGYQFVGRTLQVWSPWVQNGSFEEGKPWLLRFFDQIRFFPVSEEELAEMRATFPNGDYQVTITPEKFRMRDHLNFLNQNEADICAFKKRQRVAFEEERARWDEADLSGTSDIISEPGDCSRTLPEGTIGVTAHIPGSLWTVIADSGSRVNRGDAIAVIESMKMEIEIASPASGTIERIFVKPGQVISNGDLVAAVRPDAA